MDRAVREDDSGKPIARKRSGAQPAKREGKRMNRSETDILLAEDEPDDVEFLVRALRAAEPGTRIDVVKDGLEVLRRLLGDDVDDALQPRLILLDLNLPGLDGLEVLRCLTANARTACIPIVMLSGTCTPEDVGASRSYGARACIRKPFSGEDMQRLTEVVMRQLH
jgi:CheY-like chemotaxis protein